MKDTEEELAQMTITRLDTYRQERELDSYMLTKWQIEEDAELDTDTLEIVRQMQYPPLYLINGGKQKTSSIINGKQENDQIKGDL